MTMTIFEKELREAFHLGNMQELFEALEGEIKRHFKVKLLTITVIDMSQRKAKRLYSSNSESYAIGGFKDIEDNAWTKHVIEQMKPFIANEHSELAKVFFDHQLIADLGLGAVINWPVVFNSQVIGTVNLLAEERAYSDVELQHLESMTAWLSIPFFIELANKE